jgi:hypothetical protein
VIHLAPVLAVFVTLAGPAGAAPLQEPVEQPDDAVQRLAAWPEVPKERAQEVRSDVQRLRKAATEEMGTQAQAALTAAGAMVAPTLLDALGKERDEAARARIVAVLTAVTDARHTRLLAEAFDDRAQVVRTWALTRVAGFPDAGTRAPAEAALAAAAKVREPERDDREEHLAAALAATAAGSLAGLEHLAERAQKVWGERGAAMRVALEAVRGPEATEIAARGLDGERVEMIAALHLLAGCGAPEVTARIKPLLDDGDNSIRIAAINALRGIVDGDPPLEKLPVFEAIEVAKGWKARV